MTTSIHPVLIAFLATLAVACGSSASGGQTPSTNAAPSLRNDVLPIFQASCSTNSTCHGSPTGIEVFLTGSTAQASAIRRSLVGIPSSELATMAYITAGDPTNSYLMHKIDGTLGDFTAHCEQSNCGQQMPKGEAPLSASDRDVIRSWIEQGALDN
jgi:hypothetical protein